MLDAYTITPVSRLSQYCLCRSGKKKSWRLADLMLWSLLMRWSSRRRITSRSSTGGTSSLTRPTGSRMRTQFCPRFVSLLQLCKTQTRQFCVIWYAWLYMQSFCHVQPRYVSYSAPIQRHTFCCGSHKRALLSWLFMPICIAIHNPKLCVKRYTWQYPCYLFASAGYNSPEHDQLQSAHSV